MDKKAAGVDAGKKNNSVVKAPTGPTKKHGVAADLGGGGTPDKDKDKGKDPCTTGPRGGC